MPTLYEILLRFNDAGKLQGAHVQYCANGVPGIATSLSLVAAKDKPTLKAAIGEAMLAALEAKETAEERATEAKSAADAAEAKVASVSGQIAVTEQLAAKDAIIQELLGHIAKLDADAGREVITAPDPRFFNAGITDSLVAFIPPG